MELLWNGIFQSVGMADSVLPAEWGQNAASGAFSSLSRTRDGHLRRPGNWIMPDWRQVDPCRL